MNRLSRIAPLLLTLALLATVPSVSPAAPKNDGRPDGGALAYGEYGRPATLDPITSNEMISLRISELVFNGLVGIDEKQVIVPELAERWETSKDGRTYTFFLRKDVRWHPREGEAPKPFTADDVIFTYNIMMHPKTITPLKVRYEFIDKVEKADDATVRFTLKRPILNALAKFSFKIIPAHGPANPQFLTREDPFVRAPIGTGPYVVKGVTGDREIVLMANEDYFKGRAHINKFVSRPFADQNIMTQAMMFNAIDMLVLVNPRDLPELQGDTRFVLQPYNALSYAFFGYTLRNPLLADKRVRRAFTHAVNRQEMLDSFFNGQGTIISGPFAPGSWAYNLDVHLKGIGVGVKVEFKEWQAWKEAVFVEHDFDVILASWVFDDSADISSLFHSAEIGAWKNNFGGYSNPEVDGLIVESKLTLDHEKRRTINRKLHTLLADEAPYTFLWTLTNYSGYHKKLRRVAIHPYKFFSFADEWFIPVTEQK
ncbi:MAG: hypothetical protein DME02_02520 [Candidatus Rokuibacteriota bacterium]|nr:MAG: hypothetical protein DME02_02520 [Candidatus Rokubacteria bacterium]